MYETENDALIFLLFILCGFVCGIIFDLFKIIRKSFGKTEGFTNFCDALYWTFFTVFFLGTNFKLNDGNIRWFLFFAMGIGFLIYFLLLSKIFVFIGVFIINLVKKTVLIILRIILWPVLFIIRKMKKVAICVLAPLNVFRKKGTVMKRFIKRKMRITRFCSKKL